MREWELVRTGGEGDEEEGVGVEEVVVGDSHGGRM